ncbi:universal stress protein [Natrialbaceae archaeon GCM10025810]|uniref:universal stress protein n=1 Tax=Halovalidus salilacus TaxID=3075124 RepID=UPI00360A6791
MTPTRARPRLPFDRLLIPIAEEGDAEATCAAVRPYLEGTDVDVVVVHVIETTEGYPDKAPREARREQAEEIFAVVGDRLSDIAGSLETVLRYGPDVVDEVFAAAEEADATVIGFTPRPGSRWIKLLSGDHSRKLTSENEIPVVVFPRRDEPALESDERGTDATDGDPNDEGGDGERILVPIDGSDASLGAVEYACSNYPDAEVTVLHVLESPGGDVYGGMTGGRSTEVEDDERRLNRDVVRLFDEARRVADEHGVTLSTLTLTGDVANAVITCAEELEAALIVVGRRGRGGGGGLGKRLLGGVSESIVGRSTVPVTIVRRVSDP